MLPKRSPEEIAREREMTVIAKELVAEHPEWVPELDRSRPAISFEDWRQIMGFAQDQEVFTLEDGRNLPLDLLFGVAMIPAIRAFQAEMMRPYTDAMHDLRPGLDPDLRVYFVDKQAPSNPNMKVKAAIIDGNKARPGTIVTMDINKEFFLGFHAGWEIAEEREKEAATEGPEA